MVVLRGAYDKLSVLNIAQDDMFRQALRCAENELYRASHVMAWAACMDYIFEKLSSDGLTKVRARYPAWNGKDIYEMAEFVPERQFVDACRALGLATKNETKALISLLDRRNECAHPSAYYPDLNMTLGYLSEALQILGRLRPKKL